VNNVGRGYPNGPVEATWLKPKPPTPRPGGLGGCPSCRAARSLKVAGSNRQPRFACRECDPAPRPPKPRPSVGAPPITGLQRLRFAGTDFHPHDKGGH
jgi:hypothetical protein